MSKQTIQFKFSRNRFPCKSSLVENRSFRIQHRRASWTSFSNCINRLITSRERRGGLAGVRGFPVNLFTAGRYIVSPQTHLTKRIGFNDRRCLDAASVGYTFFVCWMIRDACKTKKESINTFACHSLM